VTATKHPFVAVNRHGGEDPGALGHGNINSTVAYLSFVEDEIDQALLAS